MRKIASILCLAALLLSSAHACIHDKLDIQPEALAPEDSPHDERALAGPQPMRIMVEYSTLTGTTTATKNYIQNQLMPAAIAYIRSALSVTPISTLKLSSTTSTVCGLPAPSKYRTGVQTDLVIFVSAENTNDNYIAWARPCLSHSQGLSKDYRNLSNIFQKVIVEYLKELKKPINLYSTSN